MVNVVPRLIPALVGLLALVTTVPSAAEVGSGKIAFVRDGGGIYTVSPDGSGLALLRSGNVGDPRWSPDGSRIAFTEPSLGTPGEFRLLVANANGSGEHVIATTGNIALSNQPWSPDGTRIAWGPAYAGDVYTASADGGDVRRISHDGLHKVAPSWSPTGSLLVYASAVIPGSEQDWELFVASDDGTPPVQITSGGSGAVINAQPNWSPTGRSIAFLRRLGPDRPAIYLIHPDGTEQHRVVDIAWNSSGEPVWSPDGSQIAYTDAVNGGYTRFGPSGQEIFLVNADGSAVQRLTELAPRLTNDRTPLWSPDGDQILFQRDSLTTMNRDGTCEGQITAGNVVGSPSWQPLPGGPSVGLKRCHAVSVDATLSFAPATAYLGGTIVNEGTEPLTNVVVTVTATRNDFDLHAVVGAGCTKPRARVVCRVGRIARGERRFVYLIGKPRRVGRDKRSSDIVLRARFEVSADEPLLATGRETDQIDFTPRRCDSRNQGRGRIDGTRFPDRICGRRGADDIDPGDGKDVVDAGAGADTIFSQDNLRDVVKCGPGRDRVEADRKDQVARDCEHVVRARWKVGS